MAQRGFERVDGHLVHTQHAEQRVAAQALDKRGIAGQDARLGTAQELIAAEGNEARAGGEAGGGQRLVDAERPEVRHASAAQVFVDGDAALAAQRGQVAQLGAGGEARDTEIAGMDAQQQPRALVDGGAVIVQMRAVGRADLAQNRAGARHDIGNAEAVADLDQLAARDHHFAARRELVQGQKDGRGIVIHDDTAGAEQPFEQRRRVDIPLAAAALGEVVLEVAVAGRNGGGPERRASEVGMEHDAGGIDDAPQGGPADLRQRRADAGFDRGRLRAFAQLAAGGVERLADLGDDERARVTFQDIGEAIQQLVDGRQLAQPIGICHVSMVLQAVRFPEAAAPGRLCLAGVTD